MSLTFITALHTLLRNEALPESGILVYRNIEPKNINTFQRNEMFIEIMTALCTKSEDNA